MVKVQLPLLTAKSPYQEFERHCSNSLFRLSEIPTLPETKSLPLKIYRQIEKGDSYWKSTIFLGRAACTNTL